MAEKRAGQKGTSGKEKPRDPRVGLALLWGEQEQSTRGPKPSLTPRLIAEAAVAIADADGLDAVSMTKVAAEFGVSAMALYRYVPGKAELVDLMIEAVLAGRPDLSTASPGWRSKLRAWVHRAREVYRDHPWLLAATALRRQAMGPAQLAWLDEALAALEPTGLSAAQRHETFLLLLGLVRNTAQVQQDYDAAHDDEWNRLTAEILARHAARFPALTKAIAEGAFAPSDDDPLEFGLQCILNGIQALIDAPAR